MNENPYQSPATQSSDSIAAPWPRWLLVLYCVLFVVFGFAGIMTSIVTLTTSIATAVSVVGSFALGAASLVCAVLAVYGAARNYRIRMEQLRLHRDELNRIYQGHS